MKNKLKKNMLLALMMLGTSYTFGQRQITGTVIDDATRETLPLVTIMINGLKDFGMPPWPQMSDVKGWDSETVSLYAISGIPHTVLIDKDGIIIAKNLWGKALGEKLEQIF